MGESTGIAWTHHTFNVVMGCTKVSPACKHCYAEAFTKRIGLKVWGQDAPRTTLSASYWRAPLKWDRKAAEAGVRRRVFCSSLADVFEDHPTVAQERARLWSLIRETPHLDWLPLTKRPERIRECLPEDWGDGYPNVWLGTTAEDQEHADARIPHLLSVPAEVHFVSYEPALGPVDFRSLPCNVGRVDGGVSTDDYFCALTGSGHDAQNDEYGPPHQYPSLSWIIVGGESGPKARAFDPRWARAVVKQCRAAGVAPFVKQLGSNVVDIGDAFAPSSIRHKKGGDMAEWPADLRVQEFPR